MHANLNIVVVEDHDALRGVVVGALREEGHQVIGLEDAESFNDKGANKPIDLLISDINLPGEDGLKLTKRFKSVYPHSAIIIMSARGQIKDKIIGYEQGADIYLAKPVDPAELIATVSSIARRIQSQEASGGKNTLILNTLNLELSGNNCCSVLSLSEYLIVSALSRAPNKTLEIWQLIELTGKEVDDATHRALKTKITRLRKKITACGVTEVAIKAIHGHGYKLCVAIKIK